MNAGILVTIKTIEITRKEIGTKGQEALIKRTEVPTTVGMVCLFQHLFLMLKLDRKPSFVVFLYY